MLNRLPGRTRGLALLVVSATVLSALGSLWWASTRRAAIGFLPRLRPAEWIVYPCGHDVVTHPHLELSTVFKRSFSLNAVPSEAHLRVAGFHRYSLSINGTTSTPPARRGRNWKQPDQFDVSKELRLGQNEVVVTVFNTNGPPALSLSLEAQGLRLVSNEAWQAAYAGASWRDARLASKPGVVPVGSRLSGGPEPLASFRSAWPTVLLFVLLSMAFYWLFGKWYSAAESQSSGPKVQSQNRRTDLFALIALAVAWAALFANNLPALHPGHGYDASSHTAYIRYIQEHRALPLASEGWEMFQPPLYYVLSAGLLDALSLSVDQPQGVFVLRLLGLAIGIAQFTLIWACLGLLFPESRGRQRWGLLLAAGLPPLLYLAHYVTNEALAAALVTASVYVCLRILGQEQPAWKLWIALGLSLAAALLTKATALLAFAAIFGALMWRGVERIADGRESQPPNGRWLRWAGGLSLAFGLCVLLCGWHYLRMWRNYGDPLIGVWDPRTGFAWWQDDGYRTSAFYTRFGECLRYPWFAARASFADGLYATLWGDGPAGGVGDWAARPPWNYNLMAIGYWLALLPTLAVLVGSVVALVEFLRAPSAPLVLVLGLGALSVLALVQLSLAAPYDCSVKAFYGLCALLPLCTFFALGFDWLARRNAKLRLLVSVAAGVWAIQSFASFWIVRSSVPTLLSRAHHMALGKEQQAAAQELKQRLRLKPQSPEIRRMLARVLLSIGRPDEAATEAQIVLRDNPKDFLSHSVLAYTLNSPAQIAEATEHARRAVEFAPGFGPGWETLASLLLEQSRFNETVGASREGLAISPFSPVLRFCLGSALGPDNAAEAMRQLQLAIDLKPEWPQPHLSLAAMLSSRGLVGRAISEYSRTLTLKPDSLEALNNLAWIRAANPQPEFRDGAEAVRLAESVCQLSDNKVPVFVGTLAVAYAEAGRFEEAVATAQKALKLAVAAGQNELTERNQQLIQLFSSRQPYRDPPSN